MKERNVIDLFNDDPSLTFPSMEGITGLQCYRTRFYCVLRTLLCRLHQNQHGHKYLEQIYHINQACSL